jgi:hypothetical protein
MIVHLITKEIIKNVVITFGGTFNDLDIVNCVIYLCMVSKSCHY